MTVTTIREMPDELMKVLQEAAAANRRTLEEEIVQRLLRSVQGEPVSVDTLIESAQQIRRSIRQSGRHPVVDEPMLSDAKRTGRP